MTLREKAVGALVESIFQHNPALRSVNLTTTGEWSEHDLIPKQADAVIAAIEPDIRADERRKVFEALAEEWRSAAKGETSRGRIDAFHEFAFTMELRARKEAAGEDDTTTAFVASLTPHQRDYVRLCLNEERAEAAGEA